jgi:hypothetical protein
MKFLLSNLCHSKAPSLMTERARFIEHARGEVVVQFQSRADDSFSTDTSVALIIAKTASPFLRFIRLTEPVVMIEVTSPAAVLMTISETTLPDTICLIVPGK